MNDMRKWINLFENHNSEQGIWLAAQQISDNFFDNEEVREGWTNEIINRVPEDDQLFIAQDFFATYVADENKPAWISDMKITDDETYNFKVHWLNDPDE